MKWHTYDLEKRYEKVQEMYVFKPKWVSASGSFLCFFETWYYSVSTATSPHGGAASTIYWMKSCFKHITCRCHWKSLGKGWKSAVRAAKAKFMQKYWSVFLLISLRYSPYCSYQCGSEWRFFHRTKMFLLMTIKSIQFPVEQFCLPL